MNDTPSAFWDFSVRFYAQPGVAAACLDLQDQAGADVNVVLYLFFVATRSRQLDESTLATLDAAVAAWRDEVVRPLRTARRHLKACAAPFCGDVAAQLRSDIKRSELDAEHIQQQVLERLFPPSSTGTTASSPAAAVHASLDAYGRHTAALPAAATAALIAAFSQFI